MEKIYDVREIEVWPWSGEGHHNIVVPRIFVAETQENGDGFEIARTNPIEVHGRAYRINIDYHREDMEYNNGEVRLKPREHRTRTVRATLEEVK